jgi:hypothetical protein
VTDLLHQQIGHPIGRCEPLPLPICARPDDPQARPICTLRSSYAVNQTEFFMSPLRSIGPARIEVCISSPVRSRNPVLMNTMRLRTAAMHAARFADVRRSSSITPTLSVYVGSPSNVSTAPNKSSVKATSSGPCIFGLTM